MSQSETEKQLDDLLDIFNSTDLNAAEVFNTWEMDFLEGMSEKVDELGLIGNDIPEFTEKQTEKIDEIWRKYCAKD